MRHTLLSSIVLMCALFSHLLGFAQGFDFGNYRVLTNTPVGGSVYQFSLLVTVTNRAADSLGVGAEVFSASTNTLVLSSKVGFGDLAVGQAAVCTNFFTIRQFGTGVFNSAPLQWFASVQSMPLSAFISSPVSGFLTNGTNVLITGSVGGAVSGVIIGRTNVPLSGTNFSALLPLEEGRNILSVVATNPFGGAGTANVIVNRDTTAPFLSIEAPTNGTIVATRQITVTGQINDAVPGTVNPEQATVMVNGVTATLLNRSYAATDVLLAPGTNRIVVVGRDRASNETLKEIQVVFREQASQKQLVALAGDLQSGLVGTNLAEALLVELVDRDGVVQTNQPVTFDVTRGDGQVVASPDSGRSLTIKTDDKGRASVLFRLGTRAGSGNNQVTVSSPGVKTPVIFNAHGLGGIPARVSPLIPETQIGEVGKPLAQPWTAIVTDAAGNPVAGAPLTFMLMQGGGSFGGQTMITTNTDSDGRASALLTVGMQPGVDNHIVLAAVAGVTNSSATFVASAQTPQAVPNTRVIGLVLDNANRPMSNVLCIIYRTFLAAVTDANGRFVISNAPVGAIRLLVDARERGYPGDWHALEFDLVTVAGRDNSVDRPIYMLPLDTDNGAMAGGPQDVHLRLKGIPGATMTVFANSLRDLNGNRITNRVTWTEVNQERVPMAPPKGSQFSLAWTVQPPGMRFDPPARICIPNAGMTPGQMLEMYGFDHDLGAFVSLGTGTVAPDGSQVCSDSGFGITKSGWGGFIPPVWPCAAVCAGPENSACFDYITHPARSICDCPRYEERPKNLVSNVVPQVNGKKEAAGGTNTTFNFTVTSDHPDCSSLVYEWDFDDGERSAAQNPTHKFAGYRTFHPKVTVSCQSCPQSKSTEQVTAVVAPVNLVVHRPKRIDPLQTPIPHDIQLAVGAQTYPNFDNDDGNGEFDRDEEVVLGGDDELIKARIQVPADIDPDGFVELQVIEGSDTVRLWEFETKVLSILPFATLDVSDFTDTNGMKEFTFYIEGMEAHHIQQEVKLRAKFFDSDARVIGEDQAAVTIVGLAGLSWEGKFNSVQNKDWTTDGINYPLDADPNWPTAQMDNVPQGLRVFPDARVESASGTVGAPRDKVVVKARLSVEPVEPIQFHFKPFDVDDPTDDTSPLDDDPNHADDNRGASPARAGKLVGSTANGVLAVTFSAGEKTKSFDFQTTMQPGDNFRVVGSCDPTFLAALENDDGDDIILGDNPSRQRIVDPRHVGGYAPLMEVLESTNYVTPTLTVWRFLHVETDSMAAPTEADLTVTTSFTNILGNGVTVYFMGTTLPSDGSTNIDNLPSDYGRFENGRAVIGNGVSGVPLSVQGNGSNYIALSRTNEFFPIEFRAEQDEMFFPTIIIGHLTNIMRTGTNFVYEVRVIYQSSSLSNWSSFVGGNLIMGGGTPVKIVAADMAAGTLTSPALNMSVKLWDDDQPTSLPAPHDLTHLTYVMREAYVEVLNDGGGNLGYNQQTCPFLLNVSDVFPDSESSFRRDSGGADSFWVAYLLESYQFDLLHDLDPDGEGGVLGVAFAVTSNTGVVQGGNGTQVFTEACADPRAFGFPGMNGRVTAHEIGHQMGLGHWDVGESGVPAGAVPSNLMLRATASRTVIDDRLIPMHKHLIRSRIRSPGK